MSICQNGTIKILLTNIRILCGSKQGCYTFVPDTYNVLRTDDAIWKMIQVEREKQPEPLACYQVKRFGLFLYLRR